MLAQCLRSKVNFFVALAVLLVLVHENILVGLLGELFKPLELHLLVDALLVRLFLLQD